MDALGYHYLIELNDCNPEILMDADFLENLLRRVVKESGATEIGSVFHRFSPHGVSGVVLISESHFSIHTWPEHKYAAIDFFTCDKNIKITWAYHELESSLESKRSSIVEIRRGINI